VTAFLDIEDAFRVVDLRGFPIFDVGLLASAVARPVTTVMGTEAYPGMSPSDPSTGRWIRGETVLKR